jgi:hypothetical protein
LCNFGFSFHSYPKAHTWIKIVRSRTRKTVTRSRLRKMVTLRMTSAELGQVFQMPERGIACDGVCVEENSESAKKRNLDEIVTRDVAHVCSDVKTAIADPRPCEIPFCITDVKRDPLSTPNEPELHSLSHEQEMPVLNINDSNYTWVRWLCCTCV